jgi:ribonuclease HII
MVDLRLFESELTEGLEGLWCGVDEAGRGALAGPVCAAAVVLPENWFLPGLDDSKKLTAKKREELFERITQEAVAYGVAFASVEEIEHLNILGATYLAMNRAIEALRVDISLALIDGNRGEGISFPHKCVVGGDGNCASIAAASILAKVSRDALMRELDSQYPGYGLAKHKGYGTAEHYAALRQLGASSIHRPSFLKKGLHGE